MENKKLEIDRLEKVVLDVKKQIVNNRDIYKKTYEAGVAQALVNTQYMATSMGLVSGLGFTVYEHANKLIFMVAESLLIVGILMIIYKLKEFTRVQIDMSKKNIEEISFIEKEFADSKAYKGDKVEFIGFIDKVYKDIQKQTLTSNIRADENTITFKSDTYFYLLCGGSFLLMLSLFICL